MVLLYNQQIFNEGELMMLSNKTKEEIIRIFLLCKETLLSYGKILSIFPGFTEKDIENIDKGKIYSDITDKIILDYDYMVDLKKLRKQNKTKPKFPLGRTYVREIYMLAKSEKMSKYVIHLLFDVCYTTIESIKLNTPIIYKDYISDIEIEENNSNIKLCKKPLYITEEQKKEIMDMVDDISEGKTTITKIADDYGIHISTVKQLLKRNNIVLNTKFKPNKLSDKEVIDIFMDGTSGCFTRSQIAQKYKISERTVSSIKNGKSHRTTLYKYNLIEEI